MSGNTILYSTHFRTILGDMVACATDEALYLLEFSENSLWEAELKNLSQLLKPTVFNQQNELLLQLKKELHEYFEGTRATFTVPLIFSGTDFQIECWEMLQNIPYGETWTYQQQAENMKKSTAIRAMAAANGNNKIAILVPCHRVIGSNGKLTGYRGGLERKRWLLQWELKHSKKTGYFDF